MEKEWIQSLSEERQDAYVNQPSRFWSGCGPNGDRDKLLQDATLKLTCHLFLLLRVLARLAAVDRSAVTLIAKCASKLSSKYRHVPVSKVSILILYARNHVGHNDADGRLTTVSRAPSTPGGGTQLLQSASSSEDGSERQTYTQLALWQTVSEASAEVCNSVDRLEEESVRQYADRFNVTFCSSSHAAPVITLPPPTLCLGVRRATMHRRMGANRQRCLSRTFSWPLSRNAVVTSWIKSDRCAPAS